MFKIVQNTVDAKGKRTEWFFSKVQKKLVKIQQGYKIDKDSWIESKGSIERWENKAW